MERKNDHIVECDQFFEFHDDASSQAAITLPAPPVLSEEEKAFAQAITRHQCNRRRAMLTWREIFDIVQSLGYRKVAPATAVALPQFSNGSLLNPVHPGAAEAEKPL